MTNLLFLDLYNTTSLICFYIILLLFIFSLDAPIGLDHLKVIYALAAKMLPDQRKKVMLELHQA
jgi:hypothetical protein